MQVPYGATLLQRKDKLSPALADVKLFFLIQKTFIFLLQTCYFLLASLSLDLQYSGLIISVSQTINFIRILSQCCK